MGDISNGSKLPDVRYDGGAHWRAKLGFVLLASEQTIEDDMMRLRPAGVGVHFTRSPLPNAITVPTLEVMTSDLARAAATLIPDAGLDVVCYACTSGSVVIGEERCCHELVRGAPAAQATTLATACIAGLRELGAERIALATPYLDEINERERALLRKRGFDVVAVSGLSIRNDSDMVRVAPDFLVDFMRAADRREADVMFLSCGALRTLDVVEQAEEALGKPVVTSNQAMMWHCLRTAGVEDRMPGYGMLLREH